MRIMPHNRQKRKKKQTIEFAKGGVKVKIASLIFLSIRIFLKRETFMKKTRSLPRILNALVAIAALVAFFCNFAPTFSTDYHSSVHGNLFNSIYAYGLCEGYNIVTPLVIAMSTLSLLLIMSIVGFILGDKHHKLIALIEIVLAIATGVLYLLTWNFFSSANGVDLASTGETGLGAGPICVSVFSFVAAFLSFLIIAMGKKKVTVD